MRLRSGEGRLLVLLLVAYGWLFVFFERINNPNELVRVYAARALAERHTWSIGERRALPGGVVDLGLLPDTWGYVNDKALVCAQGTPPLCSGKLYAAKAPMASLLGAPVLWVLRLFGPVSKTEAVFALRWLLIILPTVIFWLAVRRFLEERGAPTSVVLAAALGSLSLTYGQMFAGHQLAALALGAAFLAGFWKDAPGWLGFFCALAVSLEYPAAPAALIVFAGAWLHRRPPLWRVLLGALPPALVLVQFHWSAFGAPWSTPYSHLENPEFVKDIAPGFMGISIPTWERVSGSLFAPWLGLFFWAPWTALILIAPRRTLPSLTACAAVAYYLVFQITHALWRSGWVVGPRYITPLVPLAALALGLALRKDWQLALLGGAGAAGVAATGLASAVCQGFPLEVKNPLREVVWPLLSHGFVPRNPLQLLGVPGLWSALPYFAALAVAMVLLLKQRLWPLALAVFVVLTAAQWTARASGERGAAHFLADQWEPNPPPGASRF